MAPKKKDRWMVLAWDDGNERSPRLYTMNADDKILDTEALALALVKTLGEHDNVMVSKVVHHYKSRRVMEKMK